MATSRVRHKKGGTVIKAGTEGVEERHFFMGSGGGRMNLQKITGKETDAWEEKKKKEAVKKKKKAPVGGRTSIVKKRKGFLKEQVLA